jgi:hypothetical protein
MGLANLCVPQDQVRAEAMKLAAEIAECSPLGLISTRATMRAGLADRVMAATNHELAEQTKLRATEDFKEGVKATQRRVANFKGHEFFFHFSPLWEGIRFRKAAEISSPRDRVLRRDLSPALPPPKGEAPRRLTPPA